MVSVIASGLSSPGTLCGFHGHETLSSHSTSLHPGVHMGTGKLILGSVTL